MRPLGTRGDNQIRTNPFPHLLVDVRDAAAAAARPLPADMAGAVQLPGAVHHPPVHSFILSFSHYTAPLRRAGVRSTTKTLARSHARRCSHSAGAIRAPRMPSRIHTTDAPGWIVVRYEMVAQETSRERALSEGTRLTRSAWVHAAQPPSSPPAPSSTALQTALPSHQSCRAAVSPSLPPAMALR